MNLLSSGETLSGFVKAFGFGNFGTDVATGGGEDAAVLVAASIGLQALKTLKLDVAILF